MSYLDRAAAGLSHPRKLCLGGVLVVPANGTSDCTLPRFMLVAPCTERIIARLLYAATGLSRQCGLHKAETPAW